MDSKIQTIKIAIIGTREATQETQDKVYNKIIEYLQEHQLSVECCFSGNSIGIDQVANRFNNPKHFIPWMSFNKELQVSQAIYEDKGADTKYDDIIHILFPYIFNQSQGVVRLIRRNMFIVQDADIVFWYTGKGIKGGTAYGIKYARYLSKPDIEVNI